MTHIMKRNKGFILVMVIAVALAMTIMVGSFSLSILYQVKIHNQHINSVKAYYLATTGVHYLRWLNAYVGAPGLEEPEVTFSLTGSDNTSVRREVVDNVIRYTSAATINNVSKTIVCELENHEDLMDGVKTVVYFFRESRLSEIKWK